MSGVTLLSSSSFRHSLLIERPLHTSDGLGGVQTHWETVRQMWGHIEPIRADMRERAGQSDELTTHRIYIRQPCELSSEFRVRRGARYFQIRTIMDPDETGRYWMLTVEESGK